MLFFSPRKKKINNKGHPNACRSTIRAFHRLKVVDEIIEQNKEEKNAPYQPDAAGGGFYSMGGNRRGQKETKSLTGEWRSLRALFLPMSDHVCRSQS